MSTLLVKGNAKNSNIVSVTPESAGWKYVGFNVNNVYKNETLSLNTGDEEYCIVILSGKINATVGGKTFTNIGNRESVFENTAPYALYITINETVNILANSDAQIALCHSIGKGTYPSRLISPEDVSYEERGEGSNVRHIYNILPEDKPADSLLVVEVKTPAGNWSSYPPHKHDQDNLPTESYLEETYYHRVNPEQGFVFQRVYTDERDIDETMAVENHDVVMVPRGYHPVGVPHGYDSYYLNVMAGPTRAWHFNNDKDHEWIIKKA